LYGTAQAQTDYSLRMWSLSRHLSGIVDDALTDAYLNPARLGRLHHTQICGAWLPNKYVTSPLSVSTTYDLEFGPDVGDGIGYSYTPLAFSFIRPVGDGMVASAGMRAVVSGLDRTSYSPSYDLDEWGSRQTLDQRVGGLDQGDEKVHLLLDLALSGRGDDTYGLRLTASHNRYRDNYLNTNSMMSIDLSNLTDTALYENFSYRLKSYEETDIAFSAGLCRSEGRVSDLSIGAAIRKQRVSSSVIRSIIEDTDADRNGDRIGGGSPTLRILQDRQDSYKDYLGFRLFGRAQWQAWEELEFVHTVSWHRSPGDGRTEFLSDDMYYSASYDISNRGGEFAYDGVVSDISISTAAGYSEEIYDGFLAMIGVKGVYELISYEEDGDGTAWAFLDQSNGAYDSLYTSSPYAQKHEVDQNLYEVIIPVGCEWKVHDYVTFRIGVEVTMYHSNSDREFKKSVAAIDLPDSFKDHGADVFETVSYDTHARFNTGIEINVRDKLMLELLAFSSHSGVVDLARYGFISIRYFL
jgi:hypothetical protein